MVCLKAHDKSSNMRRKQLLVNLYWLLIDLRIDFKIIFLTVFIKRICCYLIETKTSIKNTFLWESTKLRSYMYLYCLDWQTWSTFTGFKLLSRKTLQHQWEWSAYWIRLHKIYRKNETQSTQGGGGRSRHSWCRDSDCLQRCPICAGRVLHQRLVRI